MHLHNQFKEPLTMLETELRSLSSYHMIASVDNVEILVAHHLMFISCRSYRIYPSCWCRVNKKWEEL